MTLPRLIRLLCLALLAGAPGAFGAFAPRVVNTDILPAPDGERFLFIVEMSSSIADLQAPIEATVYELIRKGADGYIRSGDTYAVWTYNKETQAGEFGMRVWDAKKAMQQATIVAAYLNQREYEKSANVKAMMDKLTKVIHAVSNLTVFVISEGSSSSFGTPFDKNIQEDYRRLNRLRRESKRPFVTILSVRDGWFVDARVTVGGALLPMPPRMEPSVAKSSAPPTNAPPVPKGQAGTLLAIRALEPSTNTTLSATSSVAAASTTAKLAVAQPARPKVMQIITKSNPPAAKLIATAPAAPPVAPVLPKTETALGAQTNPPAAAATASSRPGSPSATATQTGLVAAVPPAAPQIPVQAEQATVPLRPIAQATPPPPQPPAAAPQPSAPASPAPLPALSVAPALPKANGGLTSLVSAPVASVGHPTLFDSLVASPAPIPVAARERNPAPAAPAPAAPPPPAPASTEPAQNLSALEAVVTTTPRPGFNWMLAYGAVLLAGAGLLVLIVARRLRSPHGSIITQSMDRR